MFDTLGRAIVNGQYDSEPFPTEAQLSEQHAVSRAVTREAVKMLTAKGLLTAHPRSGTKVKPHATWNWFDPDVCRWSPLDRKLSIDRLRQLRELRLAIEPTAAALTARAATSAQVSLIARNFAQMELAANQLEDSLNADIAFHISILEATGNPFFTQLREAVATAIRASNPISTRAASHDTDLQAHRAVLHAIQARRPEAAQKAMHSLITEDRTNNEQGRSKRNAALRSRSQRSNERRP